MSLRVFSFDNDSGSTFVVTKGTVTSNVAAHEGGGIRNAGSLILSESNVTKNEAGVDGGGSFNSGSATLEKTKVTHNMPNDCVGVAC